MRLMLQCPDFRQPLSDQTPSAGTGHPHVRIPFTQCDLSTALRTAQMRVTARGQNLLPPLSTSELSPPSDGRCLMVMRVCSRTMRAQGDAPYLEAFLDGIDFVLTAMRGRIAQEADPAVRVQLEAFLADYQRLAQSRVRRASDARPNGQSLVVRRAPPSEPSLVTRN